MVDSLLSSILQPTVLVHESHDCWNASFQARGNNVFKRATALLIRLPGTCKSNWIQCRCSSFGPLLVDTGTHFFLFQRRLSFFCRFSKSYMHFITDFSQIDCGVFCIMYLFRKCMITAYELVHFVVTERVGPNCLRSASYVASEGASSSLVVLYWIPQNTEVFP